MTAPAMSHAIGRAKMWFALLGGAVAWTLHLLLAYAMAEFGCVAGLGHSVAAVSTLSWMLLGMSAAMVALAAWALLVSYGIWRSRREPDDSDAHDTAAYVARFGLISNGIFLFVIVVESVPIFFYLGHC